MFNVQFQEFNLFRSGYFVQHAPVSAAIIPKRLLICGLIVIVFIKYRQSIANSCDSFVHHSLRLHMPPPGNSAFMSSCDISALPPARLIVAAPQWKVTYLARLDCTGRPACRLAAATFQRDSTSKILAQACGLKADHGALDIFLGRKHITNDCAMFTATQCNDSKQSLRSALPGQFLCSN